MPPSHHPDVDLSALCRDCVTDPPPASTLLDLMIPIIQLTVAELVVKTTRSSK